MSEATFIPRTADLLYVDHCAALAQKIIDLSVATHYAGSSGEVAMYTTLIENQIHLLNATITHLKPGQEVAS